MRDYGRLAKFFVCTFFLAGTASAQFTITNIFNAASRQIGGPIAQGGLIAVQGKGIGTSDIEQASFPLPTTAGLGGVTMQVASAGMVIDCIIVYTKPNEIGAILPSATPLGPATLTVNNNGVTASKNFTVVASAFGVFAQTYGFGDGLAAAFNVNSDGSTTLNGPTQSVMPEQTMMINGTGLGAIPSDETQPGVTDVPSATVLVYVGNQPAAVVSAGRGTCCAGLDPSYLVPQGIAAWDVIQFTVPDGVVGCYIPVAVQIGTSVSNLTAISIDPSGAACSVPASTLPPDLAQKLANQTGYKGGSVSLSRGFGQAVNANTGAITSTKKDTGSATFFSYANIQASSVVPIGTFSENVCTINGFPNASGIDTHNGAPVTITPTSPAVALDAGTPLTVKGP